MPQETFEVGDRVLMTTSQHTGTIVRVDVETSPTAPGAPAVRRYWVELDGEDVETWAVYRGIERAPAANGSKSGTTA